MAVVLETLEIASAAFQLLSRFGRHFLVVRLRNCWQWVVKNRKHQTPYLRSHRYHPTSTGSTCVQISIRNCALCFNSRVLVFLCSNAVMVLHCALYSRTVFFFHCQRKIRGANCCGRNWSGYRGDCGARYTFNFALFSPKRYAGLTIYEACCLKNIGFKNRCWMCLVTYRITAWCWTKVNCTSNSHIRTAIKFERSKWGVKSAVCLFNYPWYYCFCHCWRGAAKTNLHSHGHA